MSDFEKCSNWVRSLPKDGPVQLDNSTKLECYGLYKQATEGDVTGTQPWAVQVEARAKWDAWNAVKGLSSDEAKAKYVAKVTEIAGKNGATIA